MSTNWAEIQQALSPIKDYEDLCRRWRESFAYPFVRETFNYSMPELINYTQLVLGGDPRGRYIEYESMLVGTMKELDQAGVQNLLNMMERVETREKLESFADQSGIQAKEIGGLLKYLIYWFIPIKKYLSGLVRNGPRISEAIRVLSEIGIRTNLDILQEGITEVGRKSMTEKSGLPETLISELVNRADFSRMPWASKATISNIIGAGYASLAELANANPEQLYADFFAYGKSIGKNLKLGNEIESSYRIAKIVPALLKDV